MKIAVTAADIEGDRPAADRAGNFWNLSDRYYFCIGSEYTYKEHVFALPDGIFFF